ncbi:MAG: VOC family protein [bacterium]|nr:VOC family protein [bacterium]
MARVLGVGGVFFRAENPEDLGSWYQKWLGLPVKHPYGASMPVSDAPVGGLTVWTPFSKDTSYFDPSQKEFMINLMVDNLDEALVQVKEGGAELIGDPERSEYGDFGWFVDPEGNKVELWQPPSVDDDRGE